jgi:hypothetical protein
MPTAAQSLRKLSELQKIDHRILAVQATKTKWRVLAVRTKVVQPLA